MRTKRQKTLINGAIFLFLGALMFFLSHYGPQPLSMLGPWGQNLGKLYTQKTGFAEFLTSLGSDSPAFFILLQALQVVISPIPGDLAGIVGGYVYGVTLGFFFSTLGLVLGSTIAFELARILGKPFVEKFVSEQFLKKLDFLASDTGATICFLLFLIPAFPTDVLCYLFGLSRMRISTFLIASTLGRMPWTFLLTLQGASIRSEQYSSAVGVAAIAVVMIFIAYLYRTQFYRWVKGLSKTDFQQ